MIKGRTNKVKALGILAQQIARGETTVMEVLKSGSHQEAAIAAELFYILRGIESATQGKILPPPPTAPSTNNV